MRNHIESAVSPVVGVMLMLVVVIIIAAVVSGLAGGMLKNTDKAPTLSMDVKIKNNGYWTGSSFSARVTGVEKAIPTKDLKIVTRWSHSNATDGTRVTGGATVLPNVNNTHLHYSPYNGRNQLRDWSVVSPSGYGVGVGDSVANSGSGSGKGYKAETSFGNYDLAVGTSMWAEPFGANTRPTAGGYSGISYDIGFGINTTRFFYKFGDSTTCCNYGTCANLYEPAENSYADCPADQMDMADYTCGSYDHMMAVLGTNWYVLRPGDIVSVSVIHIPSGKTIWEKDVTVEG